MAPFDPLSDHSSLSQQWKTWKRRFETFLVALKSKCDRKEPGKQPRDRNGEGGAAIYVRYVIFYVERLALIPANVKAVCTEIRKPNAKPIIISTWYRPPNTNSEILDS